MKPALRFRLERYAINPVIMTVLRSPLHARMSKSFVIVSYRGRRSGLKRALPVVYAEREDGGLVISAGNASFKNWWRNFAEERDVELTLGGRRTPARARLATSPEEIAVSRATYVARFPRFGETLTPDANVRFVLVDRDTTPSDSIH